MLDAAKIYVPAEEAAAVAAHARDLGLQARHEVQEVPTIAEVLLWIEDLDAYQLGPDRRVVTVAQVAQVARVASGFSIVGFPLPGQERAADLEFGALGIAAWEPEAVQPLLPNDYSLDTNY